MSAQAANSSSLLDFLRKTYPSAISASTSEADLPGLSHNLFPNTSYTDNEKVETSQWLTTSSRLAASDEDEAKYAERLGSLNIHLSTRTTVLGAKPSVADVALYHRLAPAVKSWSAEERTGEHGYHHIVRYVDFVQNAPLFGLAVEDEDKVEIDPNDIKFVRKPLDAKEEKERKKKEKAAAAAAAGGDQKELPIGKGREESNGKPSKKEQARDAAANVEEKVKGAPAGESAQQPKKEKKEKQPKPQKQPAKETPLSPCLIDLRVGHILNAENHPNADSLYVSTIACGDPPGTDNTSEYEGQVIRTVCSGLNGLVPLEEMQGRKIVAVCNLKPVTMRGIKSAAMVLAASPRPKEGEEDNHKGPVELVSPPAEAKAGERVVFDGWAGEPEGILNPKKKVWETLQPGFTTTNGCEVAFDAGAVPQLHGEGEAPKPTGRLVTSSGGTCTVKSLENATVR
ncbi:MAG: hypothetical protein Q9219_003217 [cf. Caloplaca sp. 3 TL-2023]